MNTEIDRSSLEWVLGRLSRGSERSFLTWSLGLGLILRLTFLGVALVFGLTTHFADEYQVARALLAGEGYSFDYYGLFGDDPRPGGFFPPAYVFNVYVLLGVFGSDIAVFVQNILLSLGVSLLLYRLAADLFDRPTARLALVLSLVYPPFVLRITHGSPVYFKMFLMVALVLVFQRLWVRLTPGALALAIALSGLLTLAMPDVLVFIGLASVALIVKHGLRSAAPRYALGLLVGTALVIAPWTVSNWIRFGHLTVVSTNGGYNLYMGHNAGTKHEVDDRSIVRLDERLGGELARADDFERDRILFREAFDYIRHHPGRTLINMATRGLLHWSFRPTMLDAVGIGDSNLPSSRLYTAYTWLYVVSYLPLTLVAVWGAWRWRADGWRFTPVWIAFFYSTAIAMVFVVQTKMRLIKAEPFLFLFAAAALVAWCRPRDAESATP